MKVEHVGSDGNGSSSSKPVAEELNNTLKTEHYDGTEKGLGFRVSCDNSLFMLHAHKCCFYITYICMYIYIYILILTEYICIYREREIEHDIYSKVKLCFTTCTGAMTSDVDMKDVVKSKSTRKHKMDTKTKKDKKEQKKKKKDTPLNRLADVRDFDYLPTTRTLATALAPWD